jgi:cell wall-associated NlpC family hydrolase
MSVDSYVGMSGRRLGQALVGALTALVSLLAIAVCLPVLVLAIIFGALFGAPAAAIVLLHNAAGAPAGSGLRAAPTAVTRVQDAQPADLPSTATGASVINVARRYLGVRYVFGGTDPAIGLDCSGLVQLVFGQLGVALPRTAQQQYNATSRLSGDQLQPGDLVFFARTYSDPNDWVTHVGIYIGNGQQINAPTEGQVVSIQPVFSGFWGAHFTGGGRVTRR